MGLAVSILSVLPTLFYERNSNLLFAIKYLDFTAHKNIIGLLCEINKVLKKH